VLPLKGLSRLAPANSIIGLAAVFFWRVLQFRCAQPGGRIQQGASLVCLPLPGQARTDEMPTAWQELRLAATNRLAELAIRATA
jgi:hypothetical protein